MIHVRWLLYCEHIALHRMCSLPYRIAWAICRLCTTNENGKPECKLQTIELRLRSFVLHRCIRNYLVLRMNSVRVSVFFFDYSHRVFSRSDNWFMRKFLSDINFDQMSKSNFCLHSMYSLFAITKWNIPVVSSAHASSASLTRSLEAVGSIKTCLNA